MTGWRDRLARQAFLALGPIGILAVLGMVVFQPRHNQWSVAVIACLGASALMALLDTARPFLSPSGRAWLVVTAITVVAALAYPTVGLSGNATLGSGLAVLLAALILGPRAMVGVALVLLAAAAVTGWGMTTGVLAPPPDLATGSSHPLPWVRVMFVASSAWLLPAVVLSRLVTGLENASLELKRKEEARLAAERERQRTEHRAVESERLWTVGQLAAGVAHDFNNSLAVIQVWTGIALDPRSTDADRDEAAELIGSVVKNASSLARQLLFIAGRSELAPAHLPLEKLVTGGAKMLSRVLPHDVRVRCDVTGAPATLADEQQLQQVLLNLAVNARDSMPSGGQLTLRARSVRLEAPRDVQTGRLDPGEWAVLEVADQGTGMADEVRRRAFEPFFTTKSAAKGTGLGLASVHAIVTSSGGQVDLASTGQGTTVSVWLPAHRETEGASTGVEPERTGLLAGKTVLLADDFTPARRGVHRLLADAGCQVLSADGVEKARMLMASSRAPIDVLLTDVALPGGGARALIDECVARDPTCRVLVLSATVGDRLERVGPDAGTFPLLQKPFSREQLFSALSSALEVR